MPELPDITVYIEALRRRVMNERLDNVRVFSPFLIRSIEPGIESLVGRRVRAVTRLGKRIVLGFDDDLYLVLHLMIAGRLLWKKPGARPPGKIGLAAFDFKTGTLMLTEAGSRKRAALHVVRDESALAAMNPAGADVLTIDVASFRTTLRGQSHTLKRVLTDPHVFDGIGNAYSDEILHAAGLSPFKNASNLTDEEIGRLYVAARGTLRKWIDRLLDDFGERFPGTGEITAFRPDFAVHGKFGKPCPVCGTTVQRIRYADNETNYCPLCQTEGRILADRSLSRLLRDDWPRSIDEL